LPPLAGIRSDIRPRKPNNQTPETLREEAAAIRESLVQQDRQSKAALRKRKARIEKLEAQAGELEHEREKQSAATALRAEADQKDKDAATAEAEGERLEAEACKHHDRTEELSARLDEIPGRIVGADEALGGALEMAADLDELARLKLERQSLDALVTDIERVQEASADAALAAAARARELRDDAKAARKRAERLRREALDPFEEDTHEEEEEPDALVLKLADDLERGFKKGDREALILAKRAGVDPREKGASLEVAKRIMPAVRRVMRNELIIALRYPGITSDPKLMRNPARLAEAIELRRRANEQGAI
jgi:hypothetical protein